MDFVDGEDLQEKIDQARGPLSEAQTVKWMSQVCDALSYLHSQHPPIIHRDIKPKNIIINNEDNAYLVDFGIAKIFDPTQQTTIGARAVTPGYSPVEQYGHGKTDVRTDVYALGATLYTALTAHIPVESVNQNETPLVPPRTFNPQITPALENTILTAMEIAPSRRYQTIKELKSALQTAQNVMVPATAVVSPAISPTMPSPIPPTGSDIGGTTIYPPISKRPRWLSFGFIAIILLLLVAAAIFIVPAATGGKQLPILAGLFDSDTPTPTETIKTSPSPTLTQTFTATVTNTSTRRPTNTRAPTSTRAATQTPVPLIATEQPTRTPTPTRTSEPNATSSEITLLTPTKDTKHVYQGGAGCGSNTVNFSISATGPITDHLMYIFWNVEDKATGQSIGWNSGKIMNKARGENTWTYTLDANTMIGALSFQEGWFHHQFIMQSRAGAQVVARSPTYSDITISKCP